MTRSLLLSAFAVLSIAAPRLAFAEDAAPAASAAPAATAAAAPAGDTAASIAQADELRMKEWNKEGSPQKALDLYDAALKAGADPYEIHWKKASTYFWWGENYDPDKDGSKLVDLGKKCISEAEAAAKLKPDAVEGNYYTAVCWGEYSHGISILKALSKGVEGKFKTALNKAMKVNPDFQDGAPLNAYGRFYYELPWPKRDLDKSAEYLKRNIKDTPCNLRTRVYYAETLIKKGGKVDGKKAEDVAKEQLEYVLANPHCSENPPDGEMAKAKAKKILADLK